MNLTTRSFRPSNRIFSVLAFVKFGAPSPPLDLLLNVINLDPCKPLRDGHKAACQPLPGEHQREVCNGRRSNDTWLCGTRRSRLTTRSVRAGRWQRPRPPLSTPLRSARPGSPLWKTLHYSLWSASEHCSFSRVSMPVWTIPPLFRRSY